MSYVFDSSSVFRAIKENVVKALVGGCTSELARYELGNILWKEYAVRRWATSEELKGVIRLVKDVINLMEVVTVGCHEEQIMDVAEGFGLTFYDAPYVYYASEKGCRW